MSCFLRQSVQLAMICALVILLSPSRSILAQTHVVSPADIHKELLDKTQSRQQNLERAKQLFSSDAGRRALGATRMDSARVNAAVSMLSDAELENLAARADKLEQDFAAGRISDRDLLIILLGIAALILVIVAVR